MADPAHDADACRHLWLAVASIAIMDACNAILDRKSVTLEAAVSAQMRYFNSRRWREICLLAGVSYRPDRIERFLKSPYIRSTSSEVRCALGLMERVT